VQTGFDSLRLSQSLRSVLDEVGYLEPTPIQRHAIPVLLAGKDLIARANTGSGKTAAFALSILQRLDVSQRSIQALVMCPTRELSAQVARECRKLGRNHRGLQVLIVSGGQAIRPQSEALARGVHVVVGTPGRLLDHLKRGNMDLSKVTTVVLDEADRMLDMGFQADVEHLLMALPDKKQTAMFSATFPPSIEELGRTQQQGAVRIMLDEKDESSPVISQQALVVSSEDKLRALYSVLAVEPGKPALIFCNLKASVATLEEAMQRDGLSVGSLHGDLEQFQRDQVLAKFRNHSIRILVATDVAGRGIDVKDLGLVINFELPAQPQVYVHRIGRTGRAGGVGRSVALVLPRQRKKLGAIEDLTQTAIEVTAGIPAGTPDLPSLRTRLAEPAEMATILLSGGRKDKLRPGDILGALTGEAGELAGSQVGTIEIHDRFAYVAVSRTLAAGAVRRLNKGRIKGKRFRATLV
jgi:ATP-independent RNA helicase DbpA